MEPTKSGKDGTTSTEVGQQVAETVDKMETGNGEQSMSGEVSGGVDVPSASKSPDHNLEPSKSEAGTGTDSQDHILNTEVHFCSIVKANEQEIEVDEDSEEAETPSADATSDPTLPKDGINTGESTPIHDGSSTPPTPRSTPAKLSVFRKAAPVQKISLNKEFLKNVIPTNNGPQPGASITARPMASEKRTRNTLSV